MKEDMKSIAAFIWFFVCFKIKTKVLEYICYFINLEIKN